MFVIFYIDYNIWYAIISKIILFYLYNIVDSNYEHIECVK